MRAWLLLLQGFLVWTAHFFGLYIAASLFPGTVLAEWLTVALTLLACALLLLFALQGWRRRSPAGQGTLAEWLDGLALLGVAVAAVAVIYQGLSVIAA